jgi:hypothetical protein
MWLVLAGIALISLILFFRGPNAVWGGLTLGTLVGFLLAMIAFIRAGQFPWSTVGKSIMVGILLGLAAEIVGRLANRAKARK